MTLDFASLEELNFEPLHTNKNKKPKKSKKNTKKQKDILCGIQHGKSNDIYDPYYKVLNDYLETTPSHKKKSKKNRKNKPSWNGDWINYYSDDENENENIEEEDTYKSIYPLFNNFEKSAQTPVTGIYADDEIGQDYYSTEDLFNISHNNDNEFDNLDEYDNNDDDEIDFSDTYDRKNIRPQKPYDMQDIYIPEEHDNINEENDIIWQENEKNDFPYIEENFEKGNIIEGILYIIFGIIILFALEFAFTSGFTYIKRI